MWEDHFGRELKTGDLICINRPGGIGILVKKCSSYCYYIPVGNSYARKTKLTTYVRVVKVSIDDIEGERLKAVQQTISELFRNLNIHMITR